MGVSIRTVNTTCFRNFRNRSLIQAILALFLRSCCFSRFLLKTEIKQLLLNFSFIRSSGFYQLLVGLSFTKLIKYLLFILILCISVGCASSKNYAPVRGHYKSLINYRYYVIKQGDTLYSVGFRSGHGYKHLSKWNKIFWPYKLKIGQKIKLFKPKHKLRRESRKKTKNKIPVKNKKILQKTPTISKVNKKVLRLYWQWPMKGRTLKSFIQSGSKGIDIGGKLGQKVRSASSGKVVYSGSGLKGYGKLLIIKHNYLYLSAYANNRRLLVKEGQLVKKGQVIAEVGQTGNDKPLLHFEIRKYGKPINPFNFLPKR